MSDITQNFLLILSCPDRIGIVADVSRFFVDRGCNIVESAQFEDPVSRRFFLRTAFQSESQVSLPTLREDFARLAAQYSMMWQIFDRRARLKTMIMVSKLGHCLNDLLFRCRIGALPIDLRMIVSNHNDFAELAAQNDIPFRALPITPETKAQRENQLIEIVESEGIELIILARYMQVLSDDFCSRYPGRIINIHHSLLPSFKGAQPYHRAYERGVKLIGATAHYVTRDLDEGPIIEQGIQQVRHNQLAEDLVAAGRDVEALVLSTAVRWHAEHRVLLNGGRTVVFQ